MSSPEKRTKKATTQNLSLPNELLVSCFARVSRLHYPKLSFVSKSFASLLVSPELYHTRSLLNRTESCLYVCLKFPPDPNPRWFTLCLKPNQTLNNDTGKKKKKKTKNLGGMYALSKIPIRDSPPAHWSGLVAVGSNIYNIGGCTDHQSASSSVSILDCWSHTWKMAPNMRLKRNFSEANVVDGKIYVAGGSEQCDNFNWMEVFDPKTQSWEFAPCRYVALGEAHVGKSAAVDGKVHLFRYGSGWVYDTKEFTWRKELWDIDISAYDYTVIENVLYYNRSGVLYWLDVKEHRKGKLMGLEGLPKIAKYACVKLVDYGGKMAVLWDKYLRSSGPCKEKMIWCAVIALERRNSEEIWGTVEWFDAVITVPKSYEFVHALFVIV